MFNPFLSAVVTFKDAGVDQTLTWYNLEFHVKEKTFKLKGTDTGVVAVSNL